MVPLLQTQPTAARQQTESIGSKRTQQRSAQTTTERGERINLLPTAPRGCPVRLAVGVVLRADDCDLWRAIPATRHDTMLSIVSFYFFNVFMCYSFH